MNKATGFEGLEGIPGSIGGGIFMNASAYGSCISDNIMYVDCIDAKGEFVRFLKSECEFKYRESIFKKGCFIIIGAMFRLIEGNQNSIASKIEKYHIARHSYQEFAYPTLGSMISIPSNIYQNVLRKDKFYTFIFFVLKFLLKNPIIKFFNRKRPHNIFFNKLLFRFFSKHLIQLEYKPSVKSANILINDGTTSTFNRLIYMKQLHLMIDDNFHIENELMLDAVYESKLEISYQDIEVKK